ncbi:hypothetical protein P280DRAFT_515583 [Massarina eburnea CBS 473.64]|uniref:Uncharacterized protein n=1 Tax=Massarina eburnea CBS 473.64 TaxID=1395130 RepID=A0A6A6S5I6_9PLEO|nr:hypothetical protein P280DRAFT_515583 [Massarina eburnea CBS 473.64]
MRFSQTLAVAAFAGLVAASPIDFSIDSIAVRSAEVAEAVTAPFPEKRNPVPQAQTGKKGKGKGKGKKGKKARSIDEFEQISERDAEPIDLSAIDSVIVARTPEPEVDKLVKRAPQANTGKKGKGKGKGKGKKGKKARSTE